MTRNQDPVQYRLWRPRIRLSVRALMVLVLILGGGLSWIVHSARVQRDAVAAIERAGGQVWYGETLPTFFTKVPKPPRWKRWLIDHLGVDYVENVGHVSVHAEVEQSKGSSSDQTTKIIDDSFLAHVGKLGHLRSFSIWRPNRVTAAGLAQLCGPDLKSFTLRDSLVDSLVPMTRHAKFPSLEFLDLEGSPIDAGLAPVAGFHKLDCLNLRQTRIRDRGLAHLAGLPALRTLDLSGTRITDAGLVHLARLARLTNLSLSGTSISDAGLGHLARLSQLEQLYLGATALSDAGVVHLAGLTELRSLSLRNTRITDAGLGRLAGLKKCIELDVMGTGVTDAGVAALTKIRPGITVDH